jgi:hypothetical protein
LSFHQIQGTLLHFKSEIMKWNAIITKSQYEKATRRASEISNALPGTRENDELLLLHILIRDYENMHSCQGNSCEDNFQRNYPFGSLEIIVQSSLA